MSRSPLWNLPFLTTAVGSGGRSPLPWRSGDRELLPLGESSPDGGDKLRSTKGAAEKRPSTFSGNLGFSRKPEEDHVSEKPASILVDQVPAPLGPYHHLQLLWDPRHPVTEMPSSSLTFTKRTGWHKQEPDFIPWWLITSNHSTQGAEAEGARCQPTLHKIISTKKKKIINTPSYR